MSENILPGPVEAAEIEKYLPHRYPFLLIDRVVESGWLDPVVDGKGHTRSWAVLIENFVENPRVPLFESVQDLA